jgi:riboflavin synthase
MFTGLIESVGRVGRMDGEVQGRRLRVETPLAAELTAGESVAVNGVCLTVETAGEAAFEATVSPETAGVTTLGGLRAGDAVNLERPLRADGRFGGHFVLGHVDGVGRIVRIAPQGDCVWVDVELPAALAPLVILKGSIAVDGISLTVASLAGARIGVQIVPHTWAHTALSDAREGDPVNVEADVIGKHVARLVAGVSPA